MLDVETDAYIHCVSAFVRLAQSEYQLLTDIIPEHHQKKTFDSLIQVQPPFLPASDQLCTPTRTPMACCKPAPASGAPPPLPGLQGSTSSCPSLSPRMRWMGSSWRGRTSCRLPARPSSATTSQPYSASSPS